MAKWTTNNISNLKGKTAIITGGNIGLGYEISLELARKHAHIIIACRTPEKGEQAIRKIEKTLDRPIQAEVIALDLTSIKSIRNFAYEYRQRHSQLHYLMNNAGVVNLIERQETADGHEMHMATNHYGHFALTALLMPCIKNSPGARVITMSSGAYRSGTIDFEDINWRKREYDRGKCYGDSKLANILFTIQLERYFKQHNIKAQSLGAHPGLSATERQQSIGIGGNLTKMLAQPVDIGALPALRAAFDNEASGGEYYGPRWFIRGYPKREKLKAIAFDYDLAVKLWEFTERITGVQF